MRLRRISTLLALFATTWLAVTPAYAASKEIIQLQTQVQQLQEQMTAMQRSFDGCSQQTFKQLDHLADGSAKTAG